MNLYQTAIDLVERGASRAYRLGDLYARRGQVQLQYLGDHAEAARSYEKVVELDPDNDTSVKFLESIFSQRSDWNGLIHVYEKRAGAASDDERRIDTLRRAARVAAGKLRDPGASARLYQQILDLDPADAEAQDALERWYEREADWARLVEVLRHRLATVPGGDAATALLQRIAQICEDGLRDEARAVEAYRRILDIAPANRDALEALGRIYESTEQWAEFVDVTRRQIRITTDRNLKALLYFKCGSVVEAKFGREEEAIRYYDAAIKTSPSCLPAVHGLRDLYRRREDWPRVIETLELEVKLWQDEKERAGVYAQIGRLYEQRLGQPERALELYQAALATDPECLPANQSLFEHYFQAGDWKRAAPLAAALAVKAMRDGDPTTRSEFYRRRGLVALHTGDAKAAAESLIVALEIRPVHLEALDALIDLHRTHPQAWDFDAVYRELEKLYRKRDDAGRFLARLRVAQAGSRARDGDLDQAADLYREAVAQAADDFGVLSAYVDFHLSMRRDTLAVTAIAGFLGNNPPPPVDVRVTALMRQAEIHADHEMQPARAIAVLQEVIRLAPAHEEAYYRLAQEHFVSGQYGEARAAIDQVIELAAAPGSAISPESLARYYYYRGRIIEAGGDARGATSQYRRAIDYDPGYTPPALALARRAADAGDLTTAESMLIDAAHAAMEKAGPRAAVAAQRGLARIYLAAGNRGAAIEAYRGILGVDDSPPDRVALAEIYALEDPAKAVGELRKVIDEDIHQAPAYRLLAQSYARLNEPERAARALIAMDQLGFAADGDRTAAQRMRAAVPSRPARRGLDDELRARLLATAATRDVFGELLAAAPNELAALYPPPLMGDSAVPVSALGDEALAQAVLEISRLAGVLDIDVFVGERVPGLVALMAAPRRVVIIDRALCAEPDGPRRYLLGWAFEAIRGGYAFLHHLGRRQRAELGNFLRTLLLPESERPGPTNELVKSLPRRAAKVLERYQGAGLTVDTEAWIDGTLAMAKRGGLLACDDLAAATWMIARLSGEMLLSHDATIALGAVLGGADLVRFYLSDDYQHLREHLSSESL
jgi:tetratricopeptide (TPR) repeat protein